MINIPIFRAKKIGSGEYIIGHLFKDNLDFRIKVERKFVKIGGIEMPYEPIIDTTTLAIHFPNMLDKQGNKIFASLSGDGKGGDIINCYLSIGQTTPTREKQTVKYYKPYHFGLRSYDIDAYSKLEIIGIQQ